MISVRSRLPLRLREVTSTPSYRHLSTSSTETAPREHLAWNFRQGFLDIFDVPGRLQRATSSRARLPTARAFAATTATPAALPPAGAGPSRPAVKPLPPPILFDGPARPGYRTYRTSPAKVWPPSASQ